MPALSTITLPDGNTYDLEPANREAVNIITEYTGSETNFNALEVSTVENVNYYKIKSPDDDILWQWSDDDSSKLITTKKIYPNGGLYFKDGTALPQQTAASSYNVLCIDSFSSGGHTKWCTATYSATGNTIVARHKDGYIYATYFNQSSGEQNPASYTSYASFFSSDGFLRKSSKANFTDWLGFHWSGQTAVPSYVWGGNANNTWYVYPPSVIAGLKYLGYTSSSTAKNFTIPASTTEIIITGAFTADNINKLFTASVPKNLISTTAKEIWLGGGWGGANTSAARCLCNVTLVNSTTVQVKGTASSNGTTNVLASTTFYVYYR